MNPCRISIELNHSNALYAPAEELVANVKIVPQPEVTIKAVEYSVLWYTVGKGEEDFAVHYFERIESAQQEKKAISSIQSKQKIPTTHAILCKLPMTPLSYEGIITRIRWCVRVRIFFSRERELLCDEPFQLGDIPAPVLVEHS